MWWSDSTLSSLAGSRARRLLIGRRLIDAANHPLGSVSMETWCAADVQDGVYRSWRVSESLGFKGAVQLHCVCLLLV